MRNVLLITLLALLACKGVKKPTQEEEAAEAKRNATQLVRCQKVLATLASLQAKVKALSSPPKMERSVLTKSPSGYVNFDVLLADELAEPNEFPKVPIVSDHEFAKCSKAVKAKTVSITDCVKPYVVVLKPRTYVVAQVSGDSYTPGKIDADAFVFDMADGKLIGGGRVVASTPATFSTKSSNADYELASKLGESALESITSELDVKTQ